MTNETNQREKKGGGNEIEMIIVMPPTMLAAVGSVQKSTNKSAELIELIRNILQDDIKWLRDSIEVTSRRHLIS